MSVFKVSAGLIVSDEVRHVDICLISRTADEAREEFKQKFSDVLGFTRIDIRCLGTL